MRQEHRRWTNPGSPLHDASCFIIISIISKSPIHLPSTGDNSDFFSLKPPVRDGKQSPNFGGSIGDWPPSGLRSQMQYDQLPQAPVLHLPIVANSTRTVGRNEPFIL